MNGQEPNSADNVRIRRRRRSVAGRNTNRTSNMSLSSSSHHSTCSNNSDLDGTFRESSSITARERRVRNSNRRRRHSVDNNNHVIDPAVQRISDSAPGRPSLMRSKSERYKGIKAMYRVSNEEELAKSHHKDELARSYRSQGLEYQTAEGGGLMDSHINRRALMSSRHRSQRSVSTALEDATWNNLNMSQHSLAVSQHSLASTNSSVAAAPVDDIREEWLEHRSARQDAILNMSIDCQQRFESEKLVKEKGLDMFGGVLQDDADEFALDTNNDNGHPETKTLFNQAISKVAKGIRNTSIGSSKNKGKLQSETYDSSKLAERQTLNLMDRVSQLVDTASESSSNTEHHYHMTQPSDFNRSCDLASSWDV